MPKSKNKPQAMPTGTFTITINKFRPLGGAFPVSATMAPAPDNPKSITIHGENISILGLDPVKLIFNLPNPALDQGFVLLGVAFAANAPAVTVGLHTFPTVSISRLPDSSTMTIKDQPQNLGSPQRYDYVILVQSVATGEIGIIDPDIENQGSDT
jgi:hypothetical protein